MINQMIFKITLKFIIFISMSCLQSFDNLCKKIVCPTRHVLNEHEMIQRKFKSNKVLYEQQQVINNQNKVLSILLFVKDISNLPTVLYLHGNGGSKLQCLSLVHLQFNLIAFDFSGCGKSEGEFITYGEQEVQDIDCVISFVKNKYDFQKLKFCLWGRSMGASLAIMYASYRPQNIFALILDSPFRKLRKVLENVAQHSKKAVPKIFINLALFLVQKKVQEIAKINIFNSDFLMHLNILTDIPILFCYSTVDEVVKEQDVLELYESYKGRKKVVKIEARHHQDRPKYFIEEGANFILSERQRKEGKISLSSGGKKGISLSTRKKIKQ